ncbi:serine/threonine-protein kinase [Ramlibacter sp. WS9]|uniref:serine/threonine-protein kinase n=1 Tax=Ramlibacter sp. WS9 TaxID=1882741 RepID=UPI0011449539|nr:serine/threonine-protein kinase [Ramlibacter sp. WS9]ROZ78322.1 DUF4384 domain-containing protein [Ramlibacter sp. WS9]
MSSSDEDGLTVIRPAGSTAPASGPVDAAGPSDEHNALPVGSKIAEFEVKGIIGAGGFGIVYLAHDHSLGRDVALKEYLPVSIASRDDGLTVRVKAERYAATFAAGLSSFINEARLLAQFDSPSLVKVYRFWNANGTAYMVMPFYQGPTLKQALLGLGQPPTERWLKDLLVPLMGALELLHRESCFHRDIAPDNVLLLKTGRPVLLDFGAARRVIEDQAKTLTVILKPGFAPVEQYADMPDMRQGAWTDVYALAAVVYHAIVGKAPPPSVSRIIKDTMVPLEKAAAGSYSASFLRGVDKALSIRPEDRPQSIAEFRRLLALGDDADDQVTVQHAPKTAKAPRVFPMAMLWAGLGGLGLIVVVGAYLLLREPASPAKPPPATAQVSPPALEQPSPPAAGSANAPGTPATAQLPPSTSQTPTAAPTAPPSITDALTQLHDLRDTSHAVSVTTDKAQVRIGKEKLRFRIQSEKSGYLYVFMIGTDNQHINLLFPNSLDANNRIVANQPLNLPRTGWAMTAGGPAGTNQFVAMVSEAPRDFSTAGLANAGAFAEFSKEKILAMLRSNASAGDAVLAGVPKCAAGASCSKAYGAAAFSIVEID